jgi:NTP pyrophosphatase (non-canonical NTP hydrolase)
MNELIAKIEQWAEDRNIIKGSKPIDQAMKLFSEFGELADNVGKGRDCRDDIGDVFVVLTIIAKQFKNTIAGVATNVVSEPHCFNKNVKVSVAELGMTITSMMHENNSDPLMFNIENALCNLNDICMVNDYTLQECVQIAYNDIKDRKGVMYNGVFIKESDPAYQDALDNIEADKRMASQKRISVNIEDL